MARAALLIGVSECATGWAPLVKARKHVEVMRRSLRQAQPAFNSLQCLYDASPQAIAETIETFFRHRSPQDLVLLFLTGYGIQDSDGRLYFASSMTAPDQQGQLIKSRTIPACFVQDAMNSSPAQDQILILDCDFRYGFADSFNEHALDIEMQLGGARRLILTASSITCPAPEPPELDAWSYTRYLADGLMTGAADTDYDGAVTFADWHAYVKGRLAIAAPAVCPELFGSEDLANLVVTHVSTNNPHLQYRKFVENLAQPSDTDSTGSRLVSKRQILELFRQHLGLSLHQAEEIEFQALRPMREYRQRLQLYQEWFSKTVGGRYGT